LCGRRHGCAGHTGRAGPLARHRPPMVERHTAHRYPAPRRMTVPPRRRLWQNAGEDFLAGGRLSMPQLVLLRHGESTWNLENRFTGWTDVDLTDTGREEARRAGQELKAEGFTFDVA